MTHPGRDRLVLSRVGDARPAGLWVCSLPVSRGGWPHADHTPALAGQPTHVRPLGRWPGSTHQPRRLHLTALAGGQSPDSLTLESSPTPSQPSSPTPAASLQLLQESDDPAFRWERHCVRFSHGSRSIAMVMGLRTGDAVHWWEACRLIVTDDSPTCRTIEVGGAIPLVINTGDTFRAHPNLTHPFLHKHNWLNGHLTARLHANGVCEIVAHHINSKFVDDGADLHPAVPVIGFIVDDQGLTDLTPGRWDGSRDTLTLGGVAMDVAETARLATPEKPGRWDRLDGLWVWQPYAGCELYGGACPRQRTGDAYILRPQQQTILRGMARTLRFSLSLGDQPAHVARYLAPAWWYGLCEELTPRPHLPVTTHWQDGFDEADLWLKQHTVDRGFEDGSIGRYMPPGRSRPEPGWEGELPYAIFLQAWRTSSADSYHLATRAAYHFADLGVDHSSHLARMHGYPPVAYSLPMNRTQGMIAAYLETGDDYLLQTAQAVTEAAYRVHLNSWPRLAVGRDACFTRSALMLHRYFGDEHYLHIARQGIEAVMQSQREDGSFGDQGGGTGIHQYSGYMTKPWMGLLAINGVLDWLESIGDEPAMLDAVHRLADWLLADRVTVDGARTWRFLHDYDQQRVHHQPDGSQRALPDGQVWHHESLARLLGYCALKFDDPAYLDAWYESRSLAGPLQDDHPISAAYQFIPWLEATLLDAAIDDLGDTRLSPHALAHRHLQEVMIHSPDGILRYQWAQGQWSPASPQPVGAV